jgi:XTP/dITP diphosphohydrolase
MLDEVAVGLGPWSGYNVLAQHQRTGIVCYSLAMGRLLIATNSLGKRREYGELLAALEVRLYTPHDLNLTLTVAEDGQTYAENARLKARAYQGASGIVALADDSGLEVDALDGHPGIHSARYGSPGMDDVARYQFLLQRLVGVPWDKRTARFRCTVVVSTPTGGVHLTEGSCEGIIALESRGECGFGYDPIFFLPGYGKTMAELPAGEKNRISHRARAVQKMMPVLERILAGSRRSEQVSG